VVTFHTLWHFTFTLLQPTCDEKLTSTQSLLRSPLCRLIDDSIAAKDNGYVSLEVANPESCRVTQMAGIDVPLSQMERDKI
jgi:hypothetical protein